MFLACLKPKLGCFQGELCVMPSELDVQLEVERLSVRDYAKSIQEQETLRESYDHHPEPPTSNESRESKATNDSKGKRKHKYVQSNQVLFIVFYVIC